MLVNVNYHYCYHLKARLIIIIHIDIANLVILFYRDHIISSSSVSTIITLKQSQIFVIIGILIS